MAKAQTKTTDAGRKSFDFETIWGYKAYQKTFDDTEEALRQFFNAGGTQQQLSRELHDYMRSRKDANGLLSVDRGIPIALAVPDYSASFIPVAAAMAQAGHVEGLEQVLDHGADPELSNGYAHPPIVAAAASCYSRDNVHAPDRAGRQPVLYEDALRCVQVLLERGVDVNSTSSQGMTALMAAASVGHQKLVELLLDHGAEVWRQNDLGKTALHLAAVALQKGSGAGDGFCNVVGIVRALLAAGASPTQRAFSGNTVLHTMAVDGKDLTRAEFDPIVQMLLDAGAHLEAKNRDGLTPLVLAMQNNDGAKVLIPGFIEAGADIGVSTPHGTGITRFGNADSKRALKAILMAKKIGGAMGDEPRPPEAPVARPLGML